MNLTINSDAEQYPGTAFFRVDLVRIKNTAGENPLTMGIPANAYVLLPTDRFTVIKTKIFSLDNGNRTSKNVIFNWTINRKVSFNGSSSSTARDFPYYVIMRVSRNNG